MFKTFISALSIFSANVQALGFGGHDVWGSTRGFGKGMGQNMLGEIMGSSGLSTGFGSGRDSQKKEGNSHFSQDRMD